MKIFDIITEMPVVGIHHNDLDREGSFSKFDRNYMKDSILKNIYIEKLAKIPFDLYVYILNEKGLDDLAKKGSEIFNEPQGEVLWSNPPEVAYYMPNGKRIATKIDALESLREIVNNNKRQNSTAVHLILGNNYSAGGGAIKPTPWIILHRFLHTLDYYQYNIKTNHRNKNAPMPFKSNNYLNWWDFLEMKSVKSGNKEFDNDAEMFLEMATEYLYTGNIRINRDKIKEKLTLLGKENNYDAVVKNIERLIKIYKKKIDHMIEQAAGTTRYI